MFFLIPVGLNCCDAVTSQPDRDACQSTLLRLCVCDFDSAPFPTFLCLLDLNCGHLKKKN